MELLSIDLPTEKGSLVSRKYGQGARNLGRSPLRLTARGRDAGGFKARCDISQGGRSIFSKWLSEPNPISSEGSLTLK